MEKKFDLLVHRILAAILGEKEYKGSLTGYVASGSVKLFFLYCAAFLLVFFSNYLLVKVSTAEDYGAYVYTFNLLYLLAGFCLFGTDTLLVKKIPVYGSEKKYSELKGIILFSFITAVICSVVVAIVSKLITGFTITGTGLEINWWLLSLVTLVMLSITSISQASLQGLKKIVYSQVAEKAIRPLLMIIVLVAFFYSGKMIALNQMIWINIAVIGIAAVVALLLLQKSLTTGVKPVKPRFENSIWISSSASFFLLNLLYILNSRVDIFLLGLFQTNEQVGAYNIALRLSEIIGFSLVIINFVLAPVVAMLYETGEMTRLQKIVTRCSRVVLLVGSSALIVLLVFRREILLFFEVDSLAAQTALIILCAGQFVNVFFGSVGTLLTMTGFQKFSIIGLAVSIVIHILLNVILTPEFGLTGTAIAAASSLFVWNFLMCLFVNRKLRIKTTVLGVI
jgi:O-antigen/teichoic acid export membrane protein